MDDGVLLDRARRGDRDAFAVLVTRYQDELYTMALRHLGSTADAADVVQETFLRAYLNLPALHGSVRGWLHRVAVNASNDIWRRQSRHPTSALEDDEGNIVDIPDPSCGPDASAEARERAVAIRQALRQVQPEFRAAVVLRDVNELSYEEMAEALAVPIGTVKSRVSRGRAQLVAALRANTLFAAEESAR